MSIITISSIFETLDDYMHFCDEWCVSMLIDTSNYQDTLATYVYLPVWLRYVETPIKFTNDEKGIEAFKRNFCNQLNEVVLDFYTYCKENIDYFLYQTDPLNEGKPMSKNITTGINPINQTLDQEVDSTNLASGTGSQFISETVYNGVAWHKLVDAYFTPNRKTTLLKAFAWLFVTTYSPETKYDDKIEEKREVELSFVDDDENIINVQEVYPSKTYYTMSEVDINRPLNLTPENIKKDVEIAGIVGTFDKTILDYLDYPLDLTGDMDIEASDYNVDGIKEVFIGVPITARPENIKYGVDIGGIVGTYQAVDYLGKSINNDSDPYNYENNTIQNIRKSAFLYDNNIREFSSSSVTSIGAQSFGYCSITKLSLTSITSISSATNEICSTCSSLTEVNMPLLTTMNIPYAFLNCTQLQTVNLPQLTTINGAETFNGCIGLINVTLPSLTTINNNSTSFFKNCTSLTTIDLHYINKIPNNMFNGCTSLTDITISKNDTVSTLNNVNAIPAGQNIQIHVPSNLISNYQTATNWSTLYNNGDVVFVAI